MVEHDAETIEQEMLLEDFQSAGGDGGLFRGAGVLRERCGGRLNLRHAAGHQRLARRLIAREQCRICEERER